MSMKLAINGAAGRMGRRLTALAQSDGDLIVVAALDSPDSALLGRDAGELAGIGKIGVALTDKSSVDFDVMIDFSTPAATEDAVNLCRLQNKPLVIGTTGHTPDQIRRIEDAAASIPIVLAGNMSEGVNVMTRLLEQAAAALGAEWDAEIVECHHRFKKDAPSGTALELLAAVERARGTKPAVVHGRQGATGQRPQGQVGVHSVRLGDTVGVHEVHLGCIGETLTLRHEAHSRDPFAAGALRAARWIIGKPPGMYSMRDVLFGK